MTLPGCAYCGAEIVDPDSIYCTATCQRAAGMRAGDVFGMSALITRDAFTPCCSTLIELVANDYVHHGPARADELPFVSWEISCPDCGRSLGVSVPVVTVTRAGPAPHRFETARRFFGDTAWET